MARNVLFVCDQFGCHCAAGQIDTCFDASLVEMSKRTVFHDDALARCTAEINSLLTKLRESNGDPNRHLSLLRIPTKGLLLAWTISAVGPESEEDEINDLFGIS